MWFIKDAEANFRKADIKKISERRRQRLDEEHNIDRKVHRDSFVALDKMYRITEKEEIGKYLGENIELKKQLKKELEE